MNRVKYILRTVFFVLAIGLIVHLNRKTDNNTESIVEFKLKIIEKVRADSLANQERVKLLIDETTKFVDDSAHVKNGMRYLLGLLILWGATELVYIIFSKRTNSGSENSRVF